VAKKETDRFEVVITSSAEMHFYELVGYLYETMPVDRAEEVANEIKTQALSLVKLYNRGRKEENLVGRKPIYRYILFNRTSRATVKIIYYVNDKEKTVYITDFFPSEKSVDKIQKRNR
jgi:plasmid stabilization system protein ParE